MSLPSDFFIAGGTLRAQAPSYVMRLADQELFEHTLAGEFCYVLTPRQMGKSSLMIRTARRLADAGRTVAILDLTGIGSGSADQWYLGLLEQIARDLRLNIDVLNWWQARASLAIPQRFSEFLRDVVLQAIAGPVVIFIDEIDSTLNFDFRDDFFAAIRAIYNARATESAYKRLTFALLGVATPTDLIHDRERTPFNIGRRIILQEFSYDEAKSLKAGLEACHPGQGDVILRRIFDWTNGYPYLTQKICLAAAEQPAAHWDAARVDELVEVTFFSDTGRKDPNFKFVQQRIQESSVAARRQMLNLYRKVYNGKSVPDDDRSQNQNHLELYGLVRVDSGKLNIRNDTYRRIFDQKWIEANMPANRDLRLAIGASLAALLVIVAVWIIIRQTPSPSASLYVKQFNDNEFSTARIEALAGLFKLQDSLYDRDDEQGLSLFYSLGPHDQLKLFNEANARAKGREMVTAIRRISLTLDEQDANDLAIMGEMITALRMAGGAGSDTLIKELTNWKSGRELAGKGQYEQAIGYYDRTIQLDNGNSTARYDRAMAYLKLSKYQEVLNDLSYIDCITNLKSPASAAVPLLSPTPRYPQRFINCSRIVETVSETLRDNSGLLQTLQITQYPQLVGALLEIDPDLVSSDGGMQAARMAVYSPDLRLRQWGARSLGQIVAANPTMAPRVVEVLLLLLGDSDLGLHAEAVRAIGQVVVISPEVATPQLIERVFGLLTDPNSAVRTNVVYSSGQMVISNPTSLQQIVAEFIKGLTNIDPNVQASTGEVLVRMLATIPTTTAQSIKETLSQSLALEPCDVRAKATETLRQAGANITIPVPERSLAQLCGHGRQVTSAIFSPDGKSVLTASDDNTARVWDAATGKLLNTLQGHLALVTSATFSPDGKSVLTASNDDTARLWDAATGEGVVTLLGHTATVHTADFSPDGRFIITASFDHTARKWDTATGISLLTLTGHTNILYNSVFSPNGKLILTVVPIGTARVWDAATGAQLAILGGDPHWVWDAAFSPDSNLVVTADVEGTARLWDASTGRLLATLTGHTDRVYRAFFSPDGKLIVTASDDNTARIWDLTGKSLATLRGHTARLSSAVFSLDGKLVVTASDDNTAQIWDLTGKSLAILRGHTAPVHSAVFSPDGRLVVTASDDNTARIWTVDIP